MLPLSAVDIVMHPEKSDQPHFAEVYGCDCSGPTDQTETIKKIAQMTVTAAIYDTAAEDTGCSVGVSDGCLVVVRVGCSVCCFVGGSDVTSVGSSDNSIVGTSDGTKDGANDGFTDGITDGASDGFDVLITVDALGEAVGNTGAVDSR